MQTKKQAGFTLIELMIVIAIIGILAAIAIPAYQDYVARSQMTEGMTMAAGLKTNVSEVWSQEGALTGINSGSFGIPDATEVKGKYVDNVAVVDGVITATMKGTGVSSGIQGGDLVLTPDVSSGGSIQWTCESTSVEQKYLPKSCVGQ